MMPLGRRKGKGEALRARRIRVVAAVCRGCPRGRRTRSLVLLGKAWETGPVSEETTLPRPAQVTASAAMVMLGSVIVVLLAYSTIADLRSLDTRAMVEDALKRPPMSGTGLSLDQALNLMRISTLVAGCCAAASAILGFFVLRRDRGARLGLTVLAVPLFFSGLTTGGFAAWMVTLASLTLWSQPARDWFNGIRIPETASAGARGLFGPGGFGGFGAGPRSGSTGSGSTGSGSTGSGVSGLGREVNTTTPVWPVPASPDAMPRVDVEQRPAAVLWAAVLTWICAGTVGLVAAIAVTVLAADSDAVMTQVLRENPEVADMGIDRNVLITGTVLLGLIVVAWCLVACVIAAFAIRGAGWARLLLLASTTVATVLMASSAATAFFLVPFAFAGVATIVLLMRPQARQWFRARREQRAPLL